jgi:hypothetical protein
MDTVTETPKFWRKADGEPPDGDSPLAAGQVGGDIQAGDGWSIRYVPMDQPQDGLYALVTVSVYPVAHWQINGLKPGEKPRWAWQQQIEYLVCTDIEDPGSTEEYSDVAYHDSYYDYASLEEATVAAKAFFDDWSAGDTTWDGRSRIEH